jgi:hypothetical protein
MKRGCPFFSILFLTLPLFVFTEEAKQEEKEKAREERKERHHKYIESKLSTLADAYIPALKNPINIWAEVGVLYFVPKISSMRYVSDETDVKTTSNFSQLPLEKVSFEWQPGFEVGVGYVQPKWHWDITLRGMHYHSATHSSHKASDVSYQGMFPVWSLAEDSLASDYVTHASMKGRLHFDRILLQSGYFAQLSSMFVLRTFLGIENIFLKQGYDIEYSGGIFSGGPDLIHMKNNFIGAGPQVGLLPWLSLGMGLSISATASVSCLFGSFNVDQQETYLGAELYESERHKTKGCWATDAKANIQWKRLFYHNHFSFSLRLSWEYMVYYKQNMLKKDPYEKLHGGGVQMQGLILSTMFDF